MARTRFLNRNKKHMKKKQNKFLGLNGKIGASPADLPLSAEEQSLMDSFKLSFPPSTRREIVHDVDNVMEVLHTIKALMDGKSLSEIVKTTSRLDWLLSTTKIGYHLSLILREMNGNTAAEQDTAFQRFSLDTGVSEASFPLLEGSLNVGGVRNAEILAPDEAQMKPCEVEDACGSLINSEPSGIASSGVQANFPGSFERKAGSITLYASHSAKAIEKISSITQVAFENNFEIAKGILKQKLTQIEEALDECMQLLVKHMMEVEELDKSNETKQLALASKMLKDLGTALLIKEYLFLGPSLEQTCCGSELTSESLNQNHLLEGLTHLTLPSYNFLSISGLFDDTVHLHLAPTSKWVVLAFHNYHEVCSKVECNSKVQGLIDVYVDRASCVSLLQKTQNNSWIYTPSAKGWDGILDSLTGTSFWPVVWLASSAFQRRRRTAREVYEAEPYFEWITRANSQIRLYAKIVFTLAILVGGSACAITVFDFLFNSMRFLYYVTAKSVLRSQFRLRYGLLSETSGDHKRYKEKISVIEGYTSRTFLNFLRILQDALFYSGIPGREVERFTAQLGHLLCGLQDTTKSSLFQNTIQSTRQLIEDVLRNGEMSILRRKVMKFYQSLEGEQRELIAQLTEALLMVMTERIRLEKFNNTNHFSTREHLKRACLFCVISVLF
uniref:Uncharacterized protein n=1 Tax=Candidozyma auris TaxID=498019 RepID=A0A0L0P0R8_CANAR